MAGNARVRSQRCRWQGAGVVLALALELIGIADAGAQRTPTAAEYVKAVAGDAWIVAPGELDLDGQKVSCGHRPTVLHNELDGYAAAYPGFIILNPKRLETVPASVKLWSYAHECAHQLRGPDETVADCFAVQQGRQQGWLTSAGLDQICRFIASARASSVHLAGPRRCDAMRACYADHSIP